MRKVEDRRLKELGIDAEALKEEYLGQGNGARYNVARADDGTVVLIPVRRGKAPPIFTDYRFDELPSRFPYESN